MLSTLLAVDFAPIIAPILEVINALLWPCIAIVGAVGSIYCVFLGIKIAKSDEQNSRQKAKQDLIGAIVGFLIIFVLIVALKIAMPILQNWVANRYRRNTQVGDWLFGWCTICCILCKKALRIS